MTTCPTYLLEDERTRRQVLDRLGELVVKPTAESGGKGVFIGPQATAEACSRQARLIEGAPERFIAQELVHLSTVPTVTPDGKLAPRHVDLRPFAVFGEEIRIVPGGLTRVALEEGSMIVNSSRGGGSKDTWVLDDDSTEDLEFGERPQQPPPATPRSPIWRLAGPVPAATAAAGLMLARIAQELFWLGRDLTRAEHTARMLDGAFTPTSPGCRGSAGSRSAGTPCWRSSERSRRRPARARRRPWSRRRASRPSLEAGRSRSVATRSRGC